MLIVFYSESLLYQWIQGYSTIFSPLKLSVSGLMLKYLIDLELSFVQGGKYESIRIIRIILHVPNLLTCTNCLRNTHFSSVYLSKFRCP